ncbi:MAG: CIS tube protein [Thermoanaerobaculia bacterium]
MTVVWGGKSPSFSGVIDGMSTKYTLFLPDGTPCRATVHLRMREASQVRNKPADPCP